VRCVDAYLDRLAVLARFRVEIAAEAVRATYGDRTAAARLERRRASNVIPAEADARCRHPAGVQIRTGGQPIQHGAEWFLEFRLDRQIELQLALARPIEREGCHTTAQEQRGERVELFLRGIESGDQHD